jgi:hypothetical protein
MKLPQAIIKDLPFEPSPTFVRDTLCTLAVIGIVLLGIFRG